MPDPGQRQWMYEDGGGFIPPCPDGPNPLNLAPVVDAGFMQAVLPGNPATLTGTVTDDGLPIGGYLTQIWTQDSGPAAVINSPYSAVATVTLPTAGTYVFTLTATDGQLATSSSTQVVVTANLPPVVTVGGTQNILFPATIALAGTVTDDGVPGTGLTHAWSQISGPTATITSPANLSTTVTTTQVGAFVFRLTGNDGQLQAHADTTINTRYQSGLNPWNPLIQGTDGKLYGPAYTGGSAGNGAVFGYAINGTPYGLHNFVTGDGINPICSLIQATDGNFYGLTSTTLFRLTPTGTITVLHTFADGVISTQRGLNSEASAAGIMQASDGNIYGGTFYGGDNNLGQVFKMTLGGTFSVLHSLTGTDGLNVTGTPIQGADGYLYVPARQDNAGNAGSILRISVNGVSNVFYSFNSTGTNGANGPFHALTLASDGNFYGVTENIKIGNPGGVVYQLTPSGVYSVIHDFGYSGSAYSDILTSPLIQATDGNFYGARYDFGSLNTGGAIYKLTPSGTYSVLHGFSGTDGIIPMGVLQAADGNLYGVTRQGGTNGNGVLYRLSLGGTFTILNQFPAGQ